MKSYLSKILFQKQVLKILIVILFMIGIVGWSIPALFSLFNMSYPPKIELPLGHPKGVAVDKLGNIYCGSQFYERIQAYDSEGKFIRGFNVGFRRGSGSVFSFIINGNNELHIHVYHALLTNVGMIDYLIIYDLEGNLINTEEFPSKHAPRFRETKNKAKDSCGNLYILKGFLFPRVIKQAANGTKSIIISTPIWLWPFQGPEPTFACFFLGMFGLIFLRIKSDWKSSTKCIKPSAPSLKYFQPKKLAMLLILVLMVLAIAIALAFLISLTFERHPALIAFGAITFGIASVLAIIIILFSGLRMQLYLRKHHSNLWKMSESDSFKKSAEYGKAIKSINDPALKEISEKGDKYAKLCLLIWVILYLLVLSIVLLLHALRAYE
jgi:hypothetical protein